MHHIYQRWISTGFLGGTLSGIDMPLVLDSTHYSTSMQGIVGSLEFHGPRHV